MQHLKRSKEKQVTVVTVTDSHLVSTPAMVNQPPVYISILPRLSCTWKEEMNLCTSPCP